MNILITSVGRRSYMIDYFKNALNGNGKVHAANSEMTYAMSVADNNIITPNIYDGGYIDFLFDYCIKNEIKLIISLFDIDLPVLARNKVRFEKEGIHVIVSSSDVTDICNDKWKSYNFFIENNIKTPLSFIELKLCKEALSNHNVSFPLILKPRWGMGSIGILEAENMEELEVFYKKVKRVIQNTYLKFESQFDIDRSIIIQEKLLGQEHGMDVFNDLKGEYICTVPKIKIAMRAGETDIAEVVKHTELENLGKKLSSVVGHIGNLDVDCFIYNDQIFVLEMNVRFGGQYPFSHLAGVNFPKMILDLVKEEEIDPSDFQFQNNMVGYKDFLIKQMT